MVSVAHISRSVAFTLFTVVAAQAQVSLAPPKDPSPDSEEVSQGIPVTSELVRSKCGACHVADDKNRMSRISYRRTTPEGWQETIKRMAGLINVSLNPTEARDILTYLANNHGLAPEEAKPAQFEVEKRLIDYKYAADEATGETCIKCHSFGRVLMERRTKNEWELLLSMHRGYYPYVDFQAFRRMQPPQREPGPDGRPPDNRHPMEKVMAHVPNAFPLHTPEWTAWSATMRPPRVEGRWSLSGYQIGKGPVYGTVTITSGSDPADFVTEARYTYAFTGESIVRKGRGVVYTGFQWRGRSSAAAAPAAGSAARPASAAGASSELTGAPADPTAFREVLSVERDWREMSGRWFTGAYEETGIDVTLRKIGGDPVLSGAWPQMLKRGAPAQELRIYGANLPAKVALGDVNLGEHVRVTRLVASTPTVITVQVEVGSQASIGSRDVFLPNASGNAAITVFENVDFIKVGPEWAMARLGGGRFPKGYQQFEAIAYALGTDGKPNTPDDVKLGLVPARWSLEEYTATFDDDDIKFVGTIDSESGYFTPNVDGPNPDRRGNTNNYGDVWVVAAYAPANAGSDAKTLRARAHLLVTIPIYIKWDQPEVAR